MLLAAGMTFLLETARTGFELLLSIGAGSGLLYLLRWYWWRINAWSEIAAMAVSFVVCDRLLRRRPHGRGRSRPTPRCSSPCSPPRSRGLA